MSNEQIEYLQTIIDFAESSRVKYDSSKALTMTCYDSCMTFRVPVALLNRIRELKEQFSELS